MATAEELRMEFQNLCDELNVKYTVTNEEDNIVRLNFAADEDKPGGGVDVSVYVDFDEEGDNASGVHIALPQLAEVPVQNLPAVLMKVNDKNRSIRWLKTYISEDDDKWYIWSDMDCIVFEGTVGQELLELAFRSATIAEDFICELGDLVVPRDDKAELRAMLEALKSILGED